MMKFRVWDVRRKLMSEEDDDYSITSDGRLFYNTLASFVKLWAKALKVK